MAMSTATTRPDVSVIVPHYNDPVRLRLCLTELLKNDTRGVEIIVVDNGSPTPIDALISEFGTVIFLTEPDKGAAPARNAGVAASSGAILAFIDADCVPDLDWLSSVRSAAARADLVGGRVSVFDETPPPRSGAEAFEAVFAFNFQRYVEKQGFSGAGNLVTTRKVFDVVGLFRNGVSEDTEWTRRAVSKGFRLVYADDLRVGHPSRQDWPALREKWRRMTREGFALGGGGPKARLLWAGKALLMPVSIFVHLPKLLLSPKLSDTGERLRGAAVLVRLRLVRMIWMLQQSASGRI
jgi:glycosyltransferase involved in cell wall biosynthesis